MRLEKYQTNAIFEEIVAGGLDPNECELAEVGDEVRVTHLPSGSSFSLGGDAGHYTGNRVVGHSTLSWPFEAFTWATIPEKVRRWADDVKHDVDTPDLWAQLEREREILTPARYEASENTPFTRDEQSEVATQLRQIKEYMKSVYALSSEQMSLVDARLDELEEAAHRVGRKDWVLMFGGVMLSLVVTALLPPEAARHILATVLHSLTRLLGGGGQPPHLLT